MLLAYPAVIVRYQQCTPINSLESLVQWFSTGDKFPNGNLAGGGDCSWENAACYLLLLVGNVDQVIDGIWDTAQKYSLLQLRI